MLGGSRHSHSSCFIADTVWFRRTVGGVRGVGLGLSQQLVDEQICVHVPHMVRCSLATARPPPGSAARRAHATGLGGDAGVGDRACIGQCPGVAGGIGDWGLVLDGGGCLWWSPGIVIDFMAESKIIQEVEEASFDALELPC